MSRRRLFWCVSTLALLMAGLLGLWFFTRDKVHITLENYERIQIGMAQAEVEEILGGPPGDYTRGKPIAYFGQNWGDVYVTIRPQEEFEPTWWGKQAAITVYLSPEGRVEDKHYLTAYPSQLTFWQHIKSWFPL